VSRLKELRLHGFKSFADQTRFAFEPGVNAIIGPNGSGKSNMADAVRWVLGEQSNRSLRTRRADDVIFGGSDQRRALGMAEASLTLDNADGWLPIDFTEVVIGRRAYRSGETEYLINGARARLRDVVQLLGSGRLGANELVVVGQGTVDAALSLRPEERRQLFEEAAGVKGLQVKRNEASVRLAKALDNLTRVSDLIGELRPQVRRLALQAEHQQQHDALGTRARALVLASHQRRERAAREALGEARRRAAAADAALEAYRNAEEEGRAAISAAEARYWEAEEAARAADTARQQAREELIRHDGRTEAAAAREVDLRDALEADERDLAQALEALAGADLRPPGADVDPALAAASDAERAWQVAVTELASADDALVAAERALAEARARQSDRIAARARASEELARHRARREHATRDHAASVAQLDALRDAAATAVATHDAAVRAATEALNALEIRGRERDAAQDAADSARRDVVELAERLEATRAELAALAEPHDAATRLSRRLAAAGWPALLDAVDAPEASWPAIEAVVGGELESALLWAEHDPTQQIADARGAVRLLAPANGAADADRRAALAAVRAERTLAEWIGLERGPAAFARTVLAGDLDALLDGWRRLPTGWAAVTSQGDLADARGVVLRGRGDSPGGASARAHARRRELATVVANLEERVAAAQRAAHAATEALREARITHLAAREAHDASERAARVAREGREAVEASVVREAEGAERMARGLVALAAGDPQDDASAAGDGAERLDSLQAAADDARARRDALAVRRDEAQEAWAATRRVAEEIQTLTAGTRDERAMLEARVTQLRAAIPGQRSALDRGRAAREATAELAAAARDADAAAQSAHRAAEDARLARRGELMALERERGGVGARLGGLERASQAAAIENSRREEALAGLLREREIALEGLPEAARDVPIEAAGPAEMTEALGDAELEAELRRVRRTLSQIGSVNPFAVEEHRELAERLAQMTSQDTDLRAAIGSTEELIGALDAEITEQFDAAFRAIGERFDEYCRLLFAGGSASLQMADEADGDAPGGIEIVVRPPGKRLQRLAMLSGGERALTGVALLFAMLTVNPVPFCILDEVDAALDEANIGRFADALRRLSEAIDFVVITHNRATIEVADTIYGVTMTDAAVSRVLSLRLADLPVGVSA
jgi:chromosome segregation protein